MLCQWKGMEFHTLYIMLFFNHNLYCVIWLCLRPCPHVSGNFFSANIFLSIRKFSRPHAAYSNRLQPSTRIWLYPQIFWFALVRSSFAGENPKMSMRIIEILAPFLLRHSYCEVWTVEACTVPPKSKLPPLVSFLVRRVSFLSRRFSFLSRHFSFLSRITEAFSMAYITRKKSVMCKDCCSAVQWQIDGTE